MATAESTAESTAELTAEELEELEKELEEMEEELGSMEAVPTKMVTQTVVAVVESMSTYLNTEGRGELRIRRRTLEAMAEAYD